MLRKDVINSLNSTSKVQEESKPNWVSGSPYLFAAYWLKLLYPWVSSLSAKLASLPRWQPSRVQWWGRYSLFMPTWLLIPSFFLLSLLLLCPECMAEWEIECLWLVSATKRALIQSISWRIGKFFLCCSMEQSLEMLLHVVFHLNMTLGIVADFVWLCQTWSDCLLLMLLWIWNFAIGKQNLIPSTFP